MIVHKLKVYPSKIHLPKKSQFAWKIAEIANDNAKSNKDFETADLIRKELNKLDIQINDGRDGSIWKFNN